MPARRILLPLANPETAPDLIAVARHLLHEGQILALFVNLIDNEPSPPEFQTLKAIVQRFKDQGVAINLIERHAPTVARGILDGIREHDADLIILGYHHEAADPSLISDTVAEIAAVAPIDLIVYRCIPGTPISQVLVPVRGSRHAEVAVRYGAALASQLHIPMTTLNVNTKKQRSQRLALQEIERVLDCLPAPARTPIRRLTINHWDIVGTIQEQATPETLIMLGFTETPDHRWLSGKIAQGLLAKTSSPLMILKQAPYSDSLTGQLRRYWRKLAPIVTEDEQLEITHAVEEMARPTTNFVILTIVAATLASIGLLQNNLTVIIGSMLVSPLRNPLMGFAVGMAQGQVALLRQALNTFFLGMGLKLLTAVIIGLLVPLKIATPEMRNWSQPTVLDLGVALAAGLVVAFAMGRKDVPDALVGVAVAGALEPPICNIGLAIAFAETELFIGTVLLFVLNLVGITLSAFGMFTWMGLHTPDYRNPWYHSAISLAVLVLLAIPLTLTLLDASGKTRTRLTVQQVLEADFAEWELIELEVTGTNHLRVVATLRGAEDPQQHQIEKVERDLNERLDRPINLEIVLLKLFVPAPTPTPLPPG